MINIMMDKENVLLIQLFYKTCGRIVEWLSLMNCKTNKIKLQGKYYYYYFVKMNEKKTSFQIM